MEFQEWKKEFAKIWPGNVEHLSGDMLLQIYSIGKPKLGLPEGAKLGSDIGNYVFFTGTHEHRYPRKEGYYGIITQWRQAMNFWDMAAYRVDVFKEGKYLTSITTEWGNITDK